MPADSKASNTAATAALPMAWTAGSSASARTWLAHAASVPSAVWSSGQPLGAPSVQGACIQAVRDPKVPSANDFMPDNTKFSCWANFSRREVASTSSERSNNVIERSRPGTPSANTDSTCRKYSMLPIPRMPREWSSGAACSTANRSDKGLGSGMIGFKRCHAAASSKRPVNCPVSSR